MLHKFLVSQVIDTFFIIVMATTILSLLPVFSPASLISHLFGIERLTEGRQASEKYLAATVVC